MFKEYAFGVSNRHHIGDTSDVEKYAGMAEDTFMSLWDYDNYVIDYIKKKESISSYDGMLYMPDEFILDVDGENSQKAKDKTIGLTIMLDDLLIPFRLYFSGTGFHVGIPGEAFRWKPAPDLHLRVKDELKSHGIYEYADISVSDKTRLIRIVNTRNSKSGLWKIPITRSELNKPIAEIQALAKNKRNTFEWTALECEPVFDALKRKTIASDKTFEKVTLGYNPDPGWYTCIQKMLGGSPQGSRHQIALVIAAHFRWRFPEHVVRLVMEDWRQRVDLPSHPFTKAEMDRVVTDCYEGHGGKGYNYGCTSEHMDANCSSTCRLYKSKKSNGIMDAASMEKELVDFLSRDHNPINIGELYGQNYPVYPGETVILQAPPKSMKTMLLQNWVNSFKRPTYFLEMEMSPRQMWSRFVQIEKGWDEEELKTHYKQYANGVSQSFGWLTMDYNSCYVQELDKRLQMLPHKPEIVVIDHMGLFKSQKSDNNMKVEEVSQSIMELAIRNNVVVFAVSEITKQAYHEGMDITSAKGSFRIGYNANKVLSLTPYFSDERLVKALKIESTANREKETLNVELNIDGVRIV
tara:strand:+ start:2272 stop:4005 length:1734 start_codon:yes stop_codon:yes gene_type:complete